MSQVDEPKNVTVSAMVNMNVSASNAKMLLRNLKKLKNQADEIQVESCPMFVFFDDESLVELSIILWLCN